MVHFARNSKVGRPLLAVAGRAGVPDLPQDATLADVDFDHVLILYHIIWFDSCSRMNLASPDSRELETHREIPVDQPGNFDQRSAYGERGSQLYD